MLVNDALMHVMKHYTRIRKSTINGINNIYFQVLLFGYLNEDTNIQWFNGILLSIRYLRFIFTFVSITTQSYNIHVLMYRLQNVFIRF